MGIFDGPAIDLFDLIPKKKKEEIKRKVREKVDDVIHPESELGEIIHRGRRLADTREQREQNAQKAPKNLFYDEEKIKDEDELQLADHLFVRDGVYTHHAIYTGSHHVIHYAPDYDGKIRIHIADLDEFAQGRTIQRMSEKESPLKYSREEAVKRARSRESENEYLLIGNNCEDFVRWCRNGPEKW